MTDHDEKPEMRDIFGDEMVPGNTYRLYTPNLDPILGTKEIADGWQEVVAWEWDLADSFDPNEWGDQGMYDPESVNADGDLIVLEEDRVREWLASECLAVPDGREDEVADLVVPFRVGTPVVLRDVEPADREVGIIRDAAPPDEFNAALGDREWQYLVEYPDGGKEPTFHRELIAVSRLGLVAEPDVKAALKMIENFWVECAVAEYTDLDDVWTTFENIYRKLGGTADLEAMGAAAREEEWELDAEAEGAEEDEEELVERDLEGWDDGPRGAEAAEELGHIQNETRNLK